MTDPELALKILRKVRVMLVARAVDTVLNQRDSLERHGLMFTAENDFTDMAEQISDISRLIYAIEDAYDLVPDDEEEDEPAPVAENPWTFTVIA